MSGLCHDMRKEKRSSNAMSISPLFVNKRCDLCHKKSAGFSGQYGIYITYISIKISLVLYPKDIRGPLILLFGVEVFSCSFPPEKN